jgi:uncharacterized membrane protein YbaN (DUF454 family)
LAKTDPGFLKKIVSTVGGISLILLGIVGLFLPILQGILLIVAGISLLSISNERVRNWIGKVKKRYAGRGLRFKGMKMKVTARKGDSRNSGKTGLEKGANNER